MTRNEFDAWLDGVHTGCFPGVAGWLRKMDHSERAAVLGEWFNTLKFYALADCEQASRDLWEQESQPKGFGAQPIAIKGLLRKKKHEREQVAAEQQRWQPPIDGEPTYKCLDCRDEGSIPCFHPRTVADLQRAVGDEPIRPYMISRACTCSAGDEYRRLWGTIGGDDLRTTRRDTNGMLCWRDVNDPGDRVALLGLVIESKAWN